MLNKLMRLTPLLLVVLATQSCADNSQVGNAIVQGTVTINGELAPRGQVTFYPEKKGPVATGLIHSDGSFSLRIGQGNPTEPDESKIFSGNYTATVVVSAPADKSSSIAEGGPPIAGPRLSAMKYSMPETSDLKFSVKAGRNVFPIEIEGSENDPPSTGHSSQEDSDQSERESRLVVPQESFDRQESETTDKRHSTPINNDTGEETSLEETVK